MRKLLSAIGITATAVLAAIAVIPGASPDLAGAADATTANGAISVPASIPVFDWHELNNGCASTVAVCDASDPESVSTTQLTAELAYLKSNGDHTITPAMYLAWTQGSKGSLPTNPILLIADNGIESFLAGAQPILKADGFTMAVAVISGFADGGAGTCSDPTYQPGCPMSNDNGWDATWAQLSALSPAVFDFIIEAGAAGHFVQNYDPKCTAFYACEVPAETSTDYETRVESDLSTGQSEIIAKLGVKRFAKGLWVVPYSDDGYAACADSGCTPQPYDGPAGWLDSWTASKFSVAFVQDAFRNGIQHDRFRIDVQGWMTEDEFESIVTQDIAENDFTLTNTPAPPPPPPLPPPPSPPPTSTAPVSELPVLSLDSTTLSASQIEAELAYLESQQYNTVSAASYGSWAAGSPIALPSNPILITITGGNEVVLSAIDPYLVSEGYSAVDFVSTQQADTGGSSASWSQLAALSPSAWQFSFASGSLGGTAVTSDASTCDAFYACMETGETAATYEDRVSDEVGTGRSELDNQLWMQTVSDSLWSPPFGDVGQSGAQYNGPSGWLPQWASNVFSVVFVPSNASGSNEHNALAVTGSVTQSQFQSDLASDVAGGFFNE